MSLKSLLPMSTCFRMSKKLCDKIDHLQHGGFFTSLDAAEQNLRLVKGREENVCFYCLIRETDGMICDARFQALGSIFLIGAAEIACEVMIQKNYDQVSRISLDLLDRHVRDKPEVPSFPPSAYSALNQVLSALDKAMSQCADIPYAVTDYATTPIFWDTEENSKGLPGWEDFSVEVKIKIIEEIIDKEIRPYIELDAGGVKILELKDHKEVMISYEGSCTTCHSATGSTLSAIQQILKLRIHPSLFVTPVL